MRVSGGPLLSQMCTRRSQAARDSRTLFGDEGLLVQYLSFEFIHAAGSFTSFVLSVRYGTLRIPSSCPDILASAVELPVLEWWSKSQCCAASGDYCAAREADRGLI